MEKFFWCMKIFEVRRLRFTIRGELGTLSHRRINALAALSSLSQIKGKVAWISFIFKRFEDSLVNLEIDGSLLDKIG